MKKLVLSLILTLVVVTSIGIAAPAQAKDWSVDLDLTYNSKYVWRGMVATDESVLQPSATFSFKGFSAGVWGNMDLTDTNEEEMKFTEVDFWAEYSHSFGMFTPAVGVIYYHFPPDDSINTTEIYLGLGLDVLLAPSLTIYYDVDQIEGLYVSGGISHSFELMKEKDVAVGLDLGATIGWGSEKYNEGYWGVDKGGFNDALFSVGLPITLWDSLTITPKVNYSIVIDEDLRDQVEDTDVFFAGVSVTYSF